MTTHYLCRSVVLIVFTCLLNTHAVGETQSSQMDEKVKTIVRAAHAFVTEHAHDMKAVQHALETDPRFRDDENQLYIFMHACNIEREEAICVGQGIRPELVGRNMWALRTPTGRMLFHEFAQGALQHDEFWLEYEWLNPYTKAIQSKRSFLKRVTLPTAPIAWVACGYWKGGVTAGEPAISPPGQQDVTADDSTPHLKSAAAADTPLSPLDEKVKAIVKAAHAYTVEHSHDLKTVQHALETDSRFRDNENQLYIFIHSCNIDQKKAICLGQGIKPQLIGKNMWALSTPTGRLLFHEIAQGVQQYDEFWLEYDWLNPYTKTTETKRSFIKRLSLPTAPLAWIGCGYWKNGSTNGKTVDAPPAQQDASADDSTESPKLTVAPDSPLSPLDKKVKTIVDATHAFVSKNYHDMKAVQLALENDPRFRDDENQLYIFMHSCNIDRKEAICVGQGIRPGLVGKNMWSVRSPAGILLLQGFVDLIQKHDEFWVEYEWLNPYTGKVETKRSFFRRISLPASPTSWIACGFWKRQ